MLKIWAVEVEPLIWGHLEYPTCTLPVTLQKSRRLLGGGFFYYFCEQLHTSELCMVLRGKSVIVLNTSRHTH